MDHTEAPIQPRRQTKPLKVLESELLTTESNLNLVLMKNTSELNIVETKEHGSFLKHCFNEYRMSNKNLTKFLLKQGSMKRASDLNSARHEMREEFNEKIEIIQGLLRQQEEELMSEYDNVSSCPTSWKDTQSVYEVTVASKRDEAEQIDVTSERQGIEKHPDEALPSHIAVISQISETNQCLEKTPPPQIVVRAPSLMGEDMMRNQSGRLSHLRCPSPSLKETRVSNGPNEITVGRTVDTSTGQCIQRQTRGRRTFSDYMDRQQQGDFFHPDNFRKVLNNRKDSVVQPERRDHVNQPVTSINLQEILAKQLLTKDLIKDSIEPFDGTSYRYWSWIQQINQRVQALSLTPSEHIQVLESNSTGCARKIISDFRSSCGSINQEKADEMFAILAERFGSNSIVAKDLLHKLKKFPVVKPPNLESTLRELIDLCRLIQFNMSDTPELQFLNISNGAELVREKLPSFIQDRWRSSGQLYEDQNHGRHPPFEVLIKFLNGQVRELSNTNYKFVSHPQRNSTCELRGQGRILSTKVESEETLTEYKRYCFLHQVEGHHTSDCKKFQGLRYNEKKKLIMEKKLCYLCLNKHMMASCTENPKCDKCDGRHCTAMHRNLNTERVNDYSKPEKRALCVNICGIENVSVSCSKTLLVDVSMTDVPEKILRCYAIVDEQSDCSLVDPKLAAFFGKSYPVQELSLSTVNGCKTGVTGMVVTGLCVRGIKEKRSIEIPLAYSNQCIPDTKREVATPSMIKRIKHAARYASNFIQLDDDAEVLLLIGRNCNDAMQTVCYTKRAPFIHRTSLGWAAVGSACEGLLNRSCFKTLKTSITHEHFQVNRTFHAPTLKEQAIKKNVFQEFNDDTNDSLSVEEGRFMRIMDEGITVDEDRNIVAPLPFRDGKELPDNKQAVYHRTNNTLMRLKSDPKKLADCIKSIQSNLDAHHIERVPRDEIIVEKGTAWWLPIFPVTQQRKQKTRLVFDASAQYSGVSLNDVLLKGPDRNNQLKSVLLRFREGPIAFIADIQYMFSNFRVTDRDRDFLRFYWFEDNSPNKKLVEYRSNSHIFGCNSSPAVANVCLRYTEKKMDDSSFSKRYIENDFYVDDGLSSRNSVEDAVSTLKEARNALSFHNVRLHKILSNSRDVLSAFPESERANGHHDFSNGEIPSTRTLGVLWNPEEDEFLMEVNLPEREFTKRGLLAMISSFFDPLGFAAPVILAARLIQRMILPPKSKSNPTIESYGWDDPLPMKYREIWVEWKTTLNELTKIKIQRCYIPISGYVDSLKELHIFCDASSEAIGYVIYIRAISPNNLSHVSFVTGGSKVAPKTAITIPRLELCAALEAALTTRNVLRDLNYSFTVVKFYSDSRVVLGYLSNKTRQFSSYVTRRVRIISNLTSMGSWRYIKTTENPADLSTRPQSPKKLACSMWLTGPRFLIETSGESYDHVDLSFDSLPETVDTITTLMSNTAPLLEPSSITVMCERVNSWPKACKIVRMVLNFNAQIDRSKQKRQIKLAPRQHFNGLETARKTLVKIAQHEVYGEAIKHLNKHKSLSDGHAIASLSPFIDKEGILRVGGRLRNTCIPADCKNPALLPEKHVITEVIARHYHQSVSHQGGHLTHGSLRTDGFHIVNGKRFIANMIKKCFTCRKLRAETMSQQMADLPRDRVEEVPPFTNVGLDVFGPYHIQEGKNTRAGTALRKRWALILVCQASRAVHLEMLPSMDTSAFRNALSRFIALRGTVKVIRSDNGTNFVSAANQLKSENRISVEDLQRELLDRGTDWKFNPPRASHCGGSWKRKISSLKGIINVTLSLLNKRVLSGDELLTFLQEAAAVVNNTPLWNVSGHPDDPAPLTPAALITMKESKDHPSLEQFTDHDLLAYGKRRWRRVQFLMDQFWLRWRKGYLQELQARSKWTKPSRNLEVGDIVVVKNKIEKRNNWPLARVVEAKRSSDGRVRSVSIRLASSRIMIRSVHDLVLLVPNESEEL